MVGSAQQQTVASDRPAGLERMFAAVDAAANISVLQELLQTVVVSMLRRGEDASLRERTLATISAYFMQLRGVEGVAPRDKLTHLRRFSRETIQIVFNERPMTAEAARRMAPVLAAEEMPRRRASDQSVPAAVPPAAPAPAPAPATVQVVRPEALDLNDEATRVTDVEKPTAIHMPAPPAAEKFASFRELFPAALRHRLCSLTRYFQRYNGELTRTLVRPFLLTPEFETRFMAVVETIVIPKMFAMSRNLAALETSRKWDEVSTAAFWAIVAENDKTRFGLVAAWEEAWNSCKQRETTRKGEGGETKRVLVASPELKRIREMLTPDRPDAYDIPPIRNREIDLFISMLTDFDLYRLEYCFTKLRQMYEQELDRRWYQDRARSGALRDSLLEAIDAFPDRTGDFLALLCYYCFPNTDLVFLERFTHNKGSDQASRVERLPYLMRFLAGEAVPAVRAVEIRERQEREAAAKIERERLREAEREASARRHG
ncbi:MAG TPA: hypothetical protein VK196_15315 [Magnetospirillum sp.]|nr:hypothetical protein [Magnetospirillum sp.]